METKTDPQAATCAAVRARVQLLEAEKALDEFFLLVSGDARLVRRRGIQAPSGSVRTEREALLEVVARCAAAIAHLVPVLSPLASITDLELKTAIVSVLEMGIVPAKTGGGGGETCRSSTS
jgi:hypothetical protein